MSAPRPLRIAHVTATFPPYQGGTGNVCYHNARVLAERGHDVHVYTAAWPGTADDPPGVAVHRLWPGPRIGNALLLPGLLPRLKGFDLVHLHHPFIGGGDLAAAAARGWGMPVVVTYHNDLVASGPRGALFRGYERTATRAILGSARRIAAVTASYADASPLLAPLVQRGGRVVEVPNGVDTDVFHPGGAGGAVRSRLGIPSEAFVVLFVGLLATTHPFKRVDLLLRALAALDDNAWGLIVGGGDLLARYQAESQELGIGQRIRFAGPLRQADLPPYYAAADVLALPSDKESFGIPLIEAMASGRPVIATDVPGVRSVVADGREGMLIAPGDVAGLRCALAAMQSMGLEGRSAMGALGRTKAEERYDWRRIGERLEGLYAEVIAEARGCDVR